MGRRGLSHLSPWGRFSHTFLRGYNLHEIHELGAYIQPFDFIATQYSKKTEEASSLVRVLPDKGKFWEQGHLSLNTLVSSL